MYDTATGGFLSLLSTIWEVYESLNKMNVSMTI